MHQIAPPPKGSTRGSAGVARGTAGPRRGAVAHAAAATRPVASRRRSAPCVPGEGQASASSSRREQLLAVLIATVLVAGAPIAIVWWLRASGVIASPLVGVLVGMALSLSAARVGCKLWETRRGSQDLLFNELMIWGYLHRWLTQRRLASAQHLVGPLSDAQRRDLGGLSAKEQAKLLEQLVAGIETRDPYLHGHSRRVARHAWMIAKRMGLAREEVARIRTAAAIHDLGKVQTPKAILHKAGPLTDEEYEVIKMHPDAGAQLADVLHDEQLVAMIRHHHERQDGTGYPGKLAGSDIPLGARIIAVADTFDAITSARPYRAASPHRKAIDILREDAGTRLDPSVVRAFCSHYAGCRPVTLSASLAGLPERALSWLGGSVSTVASAAKVVAVAAVVGATAATTSTLALPAAQRAEAPRPRTAAVRGGPHGGSTPTASVARASATALPAAGRRRATAGQRGHGGRRHGSSPAGAGPAGASTAPEQQSAQPALAAGSAQAAGSSGGGSDAHEANRSSDTREGGSHKTDGSSGEQTRGSGEVKGEGSETRTEATRGKAEEAPKSEASRGKPKEASGSAGGGKLGEVVESTGGKAKEVVSGTGGKAKEVVEGTTGKVGEVVEGTTGKVGEVVEGTTGKVGEVVEGTTGKVKEVVQGTGGKVEETLGKVKEILKLK